MDDIVRQREQTIGKLTGTHLAPITSAADLLGDWEMRFGGPTGSDKVQWRYGFRADGSVAVGAEQWRWRLDDDGSLILSTPTDPAAAGSEDDSEEPMFPFRADDGRVILSNEDNSLIEVLTKVS